MNKARRAPRYPIDEPKKVKLEILLPPTLLLACQQAGMLMRDVRQVLARGGLSALIKHQNVRLKKR